MSIEIRELTIKTELVYGKNDTEREWREMEKRLEQKIVQAFEKQRRSIPGAVTDR